MQMHSNLLTMKLWCCLLLAFSLSCSVTADDEPTSNSSGNNTPTQNITEEISSAWSSETNSFDTLLKMCSFKTDTFATYYGYPVEIHNITTDDGYILTNFRIYNMSFPEEERIPVIVQPGYPYTSDEFVMNRPEEGLAYFLADYGYDVWLSNSRGNSYSRAHVSKDPYNITSGFWKFTTSSMALHDNPAVIDYVLQTTGYSMLNYIGHSQSTTTQLLFLAQNPEYNKKICVNSLMAPLPLAGNIAIASNLVFEDFLILFTPPESNEILPHAYIEEKIFDKLCATNDVYGTCQRELSDDQRNITMEPVYACHSFGSASNEDLVIINDWIYRNLSSFTSLSGNSIPTAVQLSNIDSTCSIHYALGDPSTNELEIAYLQAQLPSIVYSQAVDDEKFTRTDFVLGKNAYEKVYKYIVKFWQTTSCKWK